MSKQLSKFLSLVLRHQPDKIGIVLDDAGWTDVEALLAACAKAGTPITRAQLVEIVASSDKQRFALSPDGARIRANQGHSVEVDLALEQVAPPAILFHGTVDKFLDSIRATGLIKGSRHHVHLSADTTTASKVGERRGKPVILRVRAGAMADAGHAFFRSANGVWLTDAVPPEFLELPTPDDPNDRRNRVSRGAKVGIAKQTLEACERGDYLGPHGETVSIAAPLEAARAGTEPHELGAGVLRPRPATQQTAIAVTHESTIEAIVRLAGRGHVAALNFASAKNPGGGFLGGAQAQEESLARSSGLYPCLLTQREHYERNRQHHSAIYLDLAIWSPHVPFFRDDDGAWLAAPVLASVITCAAPNASALRQQHKLDATLVETALRRRAEFVLAIAAHRGVERLILGAWGAGVFGNDPALVADAFGALLEGSYRNVFAEVVFAIMGGPKGANHAAFATRFG